MAHPYAPLDPLAPAGVQYPQPSGMPVGRIEQLPPGQWGRDRPALSTVAEESRILNAAAVFEIQQKFLQIEEEARKSNLAAAEQRGALAERERIRLEMLAEALVHGDNAARLADIDNAHRHHRTSARPA